MTIRDGKYEGLGEPAHMNLMAACLIVESALHETCYMVGSATDSREFRDVDVRVIMNDDKFDMLFGKTEGNTEPFWSLFCMAVSAWLRDRTGLPVDFQVQRRSLVKESDWEKERDPLIIRCHNPPEWARSRGT